MSIGLASTLTIPAKQERPCTRCMKRNIGHLCHDEPRETVKKSKSELEGSNAPIDSTPREAMPNATSTSIISEQATAPDPTLVVAPPDHIADRDACTTSVSQTGSVNAPQLPTLTSAAQPRELHSCSAHFWLATDMSQSCEL